MDEAFAPRAATRTISRSTTSPAVPVAARRWRMQATPTDARGTRPGARLKAPLRGALVLGARTLPELLERLEHAAEDAASGHAPFPAPPLESDLQAPERLAIDYEGHLDLAQKLDLAKNALASDTLAGWRALRQKGVFHGRGSRPSLAFLYTGQGSQYVNMLRGLWEREPIVCSTFAQADRAMAPLLGGALTDCLFADPADTLACACAADALQRMELMQPAVLAVDIALTRLLAAYGVRPDAVMGHSLGEYAALVTAGSLSFEAALEAVSARGRETARVALEDDGRMAAVFAPVARVAEILDTVDGRVEIANYNSSSQVVIGGASVAVDAALVKLAAIGVRTLRLPVTHAFHTRVLEPAVAPLRRALERVDVHVPRLPIVSNVTGDFYPAAADDRRDVVDLLVRHVAEPVRFTQGLETLHRAGVRVFVEVGPKRTLHGFVDDAFAGDASVVSLFTNHPRLPDEVAFNHALCGLYAAGIGAGQAAA